jgi:hypothetical protein
MVYNWKSLTPAKSVYFGGYGKSNSEVTSSSNTTRTFPKKQMDNSLDKDNQLWTKVYQLKV